MFGEMNKIKKILNHPVFKEYNLWEVWLFIGMCSMLFNGLLNQFGDGWHHLRSLHFYFWTIWTIICFVKYQKYRYPKVDQG